MEAEHLGLAHERREPPVGQPPPAVGPQALPQQAEVGDERRGVAVGARVHDVVGAPGPGARVEGRPELAVDVAQLLAVRLAPVALLGPPRLVRERLGVRLQALEERGKDAQPLGRAQVAVQPLDPAPQQAQGEVVVSSEGLLRRRDRHEGVTVAIASDPAPEAQERRGHPRPGVVRGHRALEGGGHLGSEVVERRLEVVEAVADLVHHVRSVGPGLLRLPERDELLPQRLERFALLLRGGRVQVEGVQQVRDARELREDGAPLGLRRVGGEHRHDEQPVEERLHLLRGRAGLVELADRGRDRLRRGAAPGVGLALAATKHPHPLLLLGEVDELEVGGEGLHDAPRLGERQRLDPPQETLAGRTVAGAVGLGEAAHVLHEVEEPAALLLDDGLAEQVAQEVHLLAQPVALGGHESRV